MLLFTRQPTHTFLEFNSEVAWKRLPGSPTSRRIEKIINFLIALNITGHENRLLKIVWPGKNFSLLFAFSSFWLGARNLMMKKR